MRQRLLVTMTLQGILVTTESTEDDALPEHSDSAASIEYQPSTPTKVSDRILQSPIDTAGTINPDTSKSEAISSLPQPPYFIPTTISQFPDFSIPSPPGIKSGYYRVPASTMILLTPSPRPAPFPFTFLFPTFIPQPRQITHMARGGLLFRAMF